MGKKNFKPIFIDYEIWNETDDTTKRCYQLTDRQVMALQAYTEYLSWRTRWDNIPDGVSMKDINLWRATLENDLQIDECGGGSMTCEDIEDCLGTSDIISNLYNNTISNEMVSINQGNLSRYDRYDGSPDSISSNLIQYPHQNTQDSIDKFCYSIGFFVDEYKERKIQQLDLAIFGVYSSIAITALFSSALGGLGFIVGGSAITAEVLALGTLEYVKSCYEDDSAINEIKCCIEDYLSGKELSFDNFEDALNQDCYTDGSNSDIVWQLLKNDRNNIDGYLYWLELLGRMQNVAEIIDDCDCVSVVGCGLTEHDNTMPIVSDPPTPPIYIGSSVTINVPVALFGLAFNLNTSENGWIEFREGHCFDGIRFNYRPSSSGVGNITHLAFYVDGFFVEIVPLVGQTAGTIYTNIQARFTAPVHGQVLKVRPYPFTSTKTLSTSSWHVYDKDL